MTDTPQGVGGMAAPEHPLLGSDPRSVTPARKTSLPLRGSVSLICKMGPTVGAGTPPGWLPDVLSAGSQPSPFPVQAAPLGVLVEKHSARK